MQMIEAALNSHALKMLSNGSPVPRLSSISRRILLRRWHQGARFKKASFLMAPGKYALDPGCVTHTHIRSQRQLRSGLHRARRLASTSMVSDGAESRP